MMAEAAWSTISVADYAGPEHAPGQHSIAMASKAKGGSSLKGVHHLAQHTWSPSRMPGPLQVLNALFLDERVRHRHYLAPLRKA